MTRPTIALDTAWRFPTPVTSTLATGLNIVVSHLPGQHLAAVELVIPTPLESEPRGVEGVATVAARASLEAAQPLADLVEQLELQGAAVAGAAAWGTTRVSASAPSWRLPAVMGLLAAAVEHPRFEEADVAHHVEAEVAAFETRMASPAAVTQQALRTALYGDQHREGRPLAGTPETLGAIGREAVVTWHQQQWRPQGATLIVAGDLDAVPAAELTGPWEPWRAEAVHTPLADAEPQAPQVLLVDLPQAAQTSVHVAMPTPGRGHPDWAALKLGGHAMCGAFASRLNLELRERLGYTYGVSGGVSARRVGGTFHVGSALSTETASDAVARLLDGLALKREFSAAEIDDAARFLVLVGPLSNETAADISRQLASLAAVGLGAEFVNEHRAALTATTVEHVNQAWRTHIRPAELTVVIGGPAATLEPQLRSAGIAVTVEGR